MYGQGFLPTTKYPHKTIIEFMHEALGANYGDLILRFDRMRRKRHDFIYDSENHTTEGEAVAALRTAQELIRTIKEFLADEYPGKLI